MTDAWSYLREGAIHKFCFVQIDLAGHSEIARNNPTRDAEATFGNFLDYIEDHVHAHGGQTWGLAGDGGLFAFHDDDVTTMAEQAVDSALVIIDNLDQFNAAKSQVKQRVRVRIAVHLGEARYLKDKGRIQSDDINFVAHLEKGRTLPDSVSISRGVYRQLYGKVQKRFRDNGMFEEHRVYTTAPVQTASVPSVAATIQLELNTGSDTAVVDRPFYLRLKLENKGSQPVYEVICHIPPAEGIRVTSEAVVVAEIPGNGGRAEVALELVADRPGTCELGAGRVTFMDGDRHSGEEEIPPVSVKAVASTPPHLEISRRTTMQLLAVDCNEEVKEEVEVYNSGTCPASGLRIQPEPSDGFRSDALTWETFLGLDRRCFTLAYRTLKIGTFQLPLLNVVFQDEDGSQHEQTVKSAAEVEVTPGFESDIMVGRTHQARQSMLLTSAGRSAAGRGQMLFIPGEAGIGKSRVLSEFSRQETLEGAIVLRGYPLSENPEDHLGHDIMLRALKQWFGIQEHERGRPAQEKIQSCLAAFPGWEERVPLFTHLLGLGDMLSDSDQNMDQDRVFEDLLDFFCNLSHQKPLILLLEDLQWGDQSSLRFVERLGKHLDQQAERILICGTYRPREARNNTRFQSLKGSLSRLVDICSELDPIERLAPGEGLEMIEGIVPGLQLEQRTTIFERSVGIPLYIREILRFLYESGDLTVKDHIWSLQEGISLDSVIPGTIRGIIERQLGTLNESARSLLNYVAVLGRQFHANILKRVVEDWVGEDFAVLCRAGLIRKVDKAVWDDRYLFVDPFTNRMVYENLEEVGHVAEIHLRIAEVFEDLHPEEPLPEEIGEIARHYEKGGDLNSALTYLVQAGEVAQFRYAYPEAVGFYTRAVEHLDSKYASLQSRVLFLQKALIGLGKSRQAMGDWKEAFEAYQRILKAEGEDHIKARAHEEIGFCQKILGEIEQAHIEIKTAQEAYEKLGDLEGYARCLLLDGRLAADQKDYPKALECYEESLSVVDDLDCTEIKAQVLTYMGMVYRRLSRFEEAHGCFDQSMPLLRELEDKRGLAYVLQTRGILLYHQDRFDEALQDLQESSQIAQKINDKTLEIACLNEIGHVHRKRHSGKEALPGLEKALKLSRDSGYKLGEATALRHLGAVLREVGDLEQARAYLQESVQVYGKIQQHPEGKADVHRELGLVYRTLGLTEQAEAELSLVRC